MHLPVFWPWWGRYQENVMSCCQTWWTPCLYSLNKKCYFCLLSISDFHLFFFFSHRSTVLGSRGHGLSSKPVLKDPRPLSDKQFQNAAVQKVWYEPRIVATFYTTAHVSQCKHWTSFVCTCYLGIIVKQVSCGRFNVSSCVLIFEGIARCRLNKHTSDTTQLIETRASVTTMLPTVAGKILNTCQNNHSYVCQYTV